MINDWLSPMVRKLIQHLNRIHSRCENIILGCTHDLVTYNNIQCCHKIFGNRTYVTDLATMCVSTAKQPSLEEIFASQVYGLTVYLKTNTHDRFGSNLINRMMKRTLVYSIELNLWIYRIRFDHRKQQCRFSTRTSLCCVRSYYGRKSHHFSSRPLHGTRSGKISLSIFLRFYITDVTSSLNDREVGWCLHLFHQSKWAPGIECQKNIWPFISITDG